MALDTRNKRFSMAGDDFPVPDGSYDSVGDRRQLLGLYRFTDGIGSPDVVSFTVEFQRVKAVGLER